MFSEASVGHSVRGVYDVTSCLDAWLHILSWGVVLRMMCVCGHWGIQWRPLQRSVRYPLEYVLVKFVPSIFLPLPDPLRSL